MAESKLREFSTDFTEYWLELFVKAGILNRETVVELYNQCGTIRRILIASIKYHHTTNLEAFLSERK